MNKVELISIRSCHLNLTNLLQYFSFIDHFFLSVSDFFLTRVREAHICLRVNSKDAHTYVLFKIKLRRNASEREYPKSTKFKKCPVSSIIYQFSYYHLICVVSYFIPCKDFLFAFWQNLNSIGIHLSTYQKRFQMSTDRYFNLALDLHINTLPSKSPNYTHVSAKQIDILSSPISVQ